MFLYIFKHKNCSWFCFLVQQTHANISTVISADTNDLEPDEKEAEPTEEPEEEQEEEVEEISVEQEVGGADEQVEEEEGSEREAPDGEAEDSGILSDKERQNEEVNEKDNCSASSISSASSTLEREDRANTENTGEKKTPFTHLFTILRISSKNI